MLTLPQVFLYLGGDEKKKRGRKMTPEQLKAFLAAKR